MTDFTLDLAKQATDRVDALCAKLIEDGYAPWSWWDRNIPQNIEIVNLGLMSFWREIK